jgi:aerobic-type carbon monoxide dehydrogenase small subunit (CoxS/CutS family)
VDAQISLRVDGEDRSIIVDTRTTLLDALRDRLGVTSPKKGCDHGQCGACTVLLDGRRAIICLAFAVAHDGAEITTAEGLAVGDALHPIQRPFSRWTRCSVGIARLGKCVQRLACWPRRNGEFQVTSASILSAPSS